VIVSNYIPLIVEKLKTTNPERITKDWFSSAESDLLLIEEIKGIGNIFLILQLFIHSRQ